jgi:hypothetical protein
MCSRRHSQLGRELDSADRSLIPHRRGHRLRVALRLPSAHRLSKSVLSGNAANGIVGVTDRYRAPTCQNRERDPQNRSEEEKP